METQIIPTVDKTPTVDDPPAHSLWGPSSLFRRLLCPASAMMEQKEPNTSNEHARNGTACHSVAEICLTTNATPDEFLNTVHDIDGHSVTVTQEMADLVEIALARTNELFEGKDIDEQGYEDHVRLDRWLPDTGGTVDLWHLSGGDLYVVDFKFGTRAVNAHRNSQLMAYALALYDQLELLYDIDTVHLVIIQPTRDPEYQISTDVMTIRELLEFGETLVDAYKAGNPETGLPEFVPGANQCRWCKAAYHCPAAIMKALNPFLNDELTLEHFSDPTTLTAEETGWVLSAFGHVEKIVATVKQNARNALLAGETIPGWKLVKFQNRLKWSVHEDILNKKLNRKVKKADLYKQVLRTPTQLKNLIDPKLFDELTEDYPTFSVVPDDDQRPAYTNTAGAIEAFSKSE